MSAAQSGKVPQGVIADAWSVLSEAVANDPGYAWGWHCNLAMPIMDATGVSPKTANEAAAHLMQHLFGHDITTHLFYEFGKSNAQHYAEMRIAAERGEDAARGES